MPARGDELVARAIRGEQDALTTLLECHGPAVWQKVIGDIPRRWQSVLTRDDVIQQTYVDAILDIHQLLAPTEEAFSAWLCTLARRNLLDAIRMLAAEKRGGRRTRVEGTTNADSAVALFELLCGPSSTASRTAARHEASAALLKAIDGLPDAYRRVVQMYDLEGRSVDEVAVVLSRSEGAVFMLRARAHRQLRDRLGAAFKYLSDSA